MVLRMVLVMALSSVSALSLSGCSDPAPEGNDLFRLAVNGVPGGSLLSVWGPRSHSGSVWLAGGFVGVDPVRLAGSGMAAGRLVEYTPGRFSTRCRANAVLWWVHGLERGASAPEIWAVGEEGTVLRRRDTSCEQLPLGLTFAEGAPTFWGVWADSPDSVWLVGGSARPTGPKGVLVHYDGTAFRRVPVPEGARNENLYKITRAADAFLIVGSGGLMLRMSLDGSVITPLTVPLENSDNRIFTVSCRGATCAAVGGIATGFVLLSTRSSGSFLRVDSLLGTDGLNGVHVFDEDDVFIVGNNGLTAHFVPNNPSGLVPSFLAPALTPATLHGVGGNDQVVLAVGGELDERTPQQRGVILVRGDASERFTFDGRSFTAQGALRRSLGGSGQ
jgi:hypothetical protein